MTASWEADNSRSLVLIGGDPGSASQLWCCRQRRVGSAANRCYIAGEESPAQLLLRAKRLGVDSEHIMVLAETDLNLLEEQVRQVRPDVLIVDSVQTVYSPNLSSAAVV